MRKFVYLLALLPSIALAQLSQRPYNPANVNITGGSITGLSTLSATGSGGVGGKFQAQGGLQLQTFLTSALPICSAGNTGLLVTATDVGGTLAWNTILPAGTGTPAASTTLPVFCDGTNWRMH